MARKSSKHLNLKKYMKEELIAIPLKLPRSQYELLKVMAETMNQALPELVALLLTDYVMPAVEEAMQNRHATLEDPTPSNANAPTVNHPSQKRPANAGPESSALAIDHVDQKSDASPQAHPSSPAAPAKPSAWRPVESPLVNDPPGSETTRGQQPTNPNLSRPPQTSTTPHSAVSLAPPANRGEPLSPTPSRPATLPTTKPASGDAEFPPKPETRHD